MDMPMDTIINKLVKLDKIADILEETLAYENDDTSVGHCRIAIIYAGGYGYVHQYKRGAVIKAFQQTGISLCPTGKDDYHETNNPNER